MAISQINSNSLASGVPARSNLPAGSVLQVLHYNNSAAVTTTSATMVASNITLSITPNFSTSKILILANANADTIASTAQLVATIYRNSTNLASGSLTPPGFNQVYSASGRLQTPLAMAYLDSPATTSSVTYTLYFASTNAGQVAINYNGATGNITLMEIAG